MVDIYQLYTDVFTNYNKDIIPSTQTIQVELIFLPTSFVSFDEIKQTLSLMGVIITHFFLNSPLILSHFTG
jgi:hypothetical protein